VIAAALSKNLMIEGECEYNLIYSSKYSSSNKGMILVQKEMIRLKDRVEKKYIKNIKKMISQTYCEQGLRCISIN
jgi:hypothetical protein